MGTNDAGGWTDFFEQLVAQQQSFVPTAGETVQNFSESSDAIVMHDVLTNTQAAPTDALVAFYPAELLTDNQRSLETDTTGWAAAPGPNATLARSTAFAFSGLASLKLTATATGAGAGTMGATTPTGSSGVGVDATAPYTVLARFLADVTARSCTVSILWYQANGTASAVRASDTSAPVVDSTTAWSLATLSVTPPADAWFAAVTVNVAGAANGEAHYVDALSFQPSTPGADVGFSEINS